MNNPVIEGTRTSTSPAGAFSSGGRRAGRLLDRARRLWRDVAITLGATPGVSLETADPDRLRQSMRECLEARGGEVSARARATQLGRAYLNLEPEGRVVFLNLLADEFGTDPALIDSAMAKVAAAKGRPGRLKAEQDLRTALESPRLRLLTQFNALPEGVKFLVDLRADILGRTKGNPAMAALEAELRDLLFSWFDIGFLELERITWRSPALILEKIAARESVHAFRDWRDMKNRLDSDRRLYAFFHPKMPDEPLIFVEVALVRGLASSVQSLLDEKAPLGDSDHADTAIFYSINNAQRGLAGINFGGFLIKRVATDLAQEFPNIRTFSTLSPIPGFRAWLDAQMASGPVLHGTEDRQVDAALAALGASGGGLAAALALPWWTNPAAADALEGPLMRLGARYLLATEDERKRSLDPVAHFHYSNGARFERLNWLADISEKGISQSAGLMSNYLYKLPDIEANHEAYHGAGRIASATALRKLAAG